MLQMMPCQPVYPVKKFILLTREETCSACLVLMVHGKTSLEVLNVQENVQLVLMVR